LDKRPTSLQTIFDIVDVKNGTYGLVYMCALKGSPSIGVPRPPLFAVKTLQTQYRGDEGIVNRFYREAETWVKLGSHENIVRADFVLEIDQIPHIFMEYVDGGNLQAYIQKGDRDIRQALDFAIQFCDGMIYVNTTDREHEGNGLVHRDIKPANIMLTTNQTVKLTDFGLVKAFDEAVTGFAGTKEYASPEQFVGSSIDCRSDMYSFGIVLYEMVTGKRPFPGPSFEEFARQHGNRRPDPPTSLNSQIPKELEATILRCLEKSPDDRYRRFEDLKGTLMDLHQRLYGALRERTRSPAGSSAIDRSVLKGLSLSSLGKMVEAVACLDEAIQNNPQDVLAWHYKGEALDRLNRHGDAIGCFDEALKIAPDHAPTWSAKGDALGNLGRFDEALRCYDEATGLKPMQTNHVFWANKGLALMAVHRYAEAIDCFNKSIEIQPSSAKAWFGKALVSERRNSLAEAKDYYDKALEANPRDAVSLCHKGNLLCRLGQFKEAMPCFEAALQINPRDVTAWTSLAGLLASLSRFEEAIRCCERAIAIAPRHDLAQRLKQLIQTKMRR
jgi:serine/threonine protein kinase/thioredoxin-like negative regulator of GroEL